MSKGMDTLQKHNQICRKCKTTN